ncbi:MAG: NifB/NifX family molybdenum-iron cluster-binding protein [Methanomassiliicoccales archaeon]|nr:NifB/NifX family molybdenum-iron cluster-binding protein [Methanomassiliicoccales archaeon]
MKIAVTSTGPGTDSMMDDRLGRCPYYIIMDTDTGNVESMVNQAARSSSGAGTRAVQSLVDKGVTVVITGRIGPHASAMVTESDMEVVTGASGRVGDVLEEFRKRRGL